MRSRYISPSVARRGVPRVAARVWFVETGVGLSGGAVPRRLGGYASTRLVFLDALVKRVYGHLGQVRHRPDVVEYRVEQHRKTTHRNLSVAEWLHVLQEEVA